MLSQTLRQLERDGLVSRSVEAKVPISVTYAITPLGQTLVSALQPMVDWAESRMPEVVEAQGAFDQRAALT
jgi:DNA-binding HxlR family transcriptional regulator